MSSLFEFLEPSSSLATVLIKTTLFSNSTVVQMRWKVNKISIQESKTRRLYPYTSVFIHSMSSLFDFSEPSSSLATVLIKTTLCTQIIETLQVWFGSIKEIILRENLSASPVINNKQFEALYVSTLCAWHSEGVQNLMMQAGTAKLEKHL